MPVRACLVVTGDGAAITRSLRPARPGRNVAASTRIGPGRCHNVMVRAWRLRDYRGKWGWQGAARRRGTGIDPHPDARHPADALYFGASPPAANPPAASLTA